MGTIIKLPYIILRLLAIAQDIAVNYKSFHCNMDVGNERLVALHDAFEQLNKLDIELKLDTDEEVQHEQV